LNFINYLKTELTFEGEKKRFLSPRFPPPPPKKNNELLFASDDETGFGQKLRQEQIQREVSFIAYSPLLDFSGLIQLNRGYHSDFTLTCVFSSQTMPSTPRTDVQ
jgi:hypothetical protein